MTGTEAGAVGDHGPDALPASWRGPGKGRIGVLRLGHRPQRDKRITTHVCLTARALGADAVYIHGADDRIEANVQAATERFGGPFHTRAIEAWRPVLRAWQEKGAYVAHLTMYGIGLDDATTRLRGIWNEHPDRDLLVIVGAEKVPPEIYESADLNVAVGNQPHSEVAALALFLDRVTAGAWPLRAFEGQVKVAPSERGKSVYPMETQDK